MREIEVGVPAVEDHDVQVLVLLNEGDDLSELGDGCCRDGVDRRVIERHPAICGTSPVDTELSPRSDLRIVAVSGSVDVEVAQGGLLDSAARNGRRCDSSPGAG